jgi:hypothetical protein
MILDPTITFACSACGKLLRVPFEAVGKRARCASCGSLEIVSYSHASPGEVPFKASDSVQVALSRTKALLDKSGIAYREIAIHDPGLREAAFGRILIFSRSSSPEIVYITSKSWTEEGIQQACVELIDLHAQLMKAGKTSHFRILSAYPIPPRIAFLFGNSLASQYEIGFRTQYPLGAVVPPNHMTALAEKYASFLVKSLLGVALDFGDTKSISILEQLVLEKIRPYTDPAKEVPEGSFGPQGVLLCLGAAFGEVLRGLPEIQSEWEVSDQCAFSVGMRHTHRQSGLSVVSNPVGKLMRLYDSGNGESLSSFVAGLKQRLTPSPT